MLSVTPMKFTSVSNPRLAQALRVQGIRHQLLDASVQCDAYMQYTFLALLLSVTSMDCPPTHFLLSLLRRAC